MSLSLRQVEWRAALSREAFEAARRCYVIGDTAMVIRSALQSFANNGDENLSTATSTATPGGCVREPGYWKMHAQWPVNQLQLGDRTYNRQELQSILEQKVRGNALVQLAHQEIAAKLNIARGAEGSCVQQTLAAVDALIGNLVIPPVGNGYLRPNNYTGDLTRYNKGKLCSPHCDPSPPPQSTPTATPKRRPTAAPRPGH